MSTSAKPMTAQRLREMAALLLGAARRYDHLARTCKDSANDALANHDPSGMTPDQYRSAAAIYMLDAQRCRDAAKDLQEFSFSWKG